MNMSLEEAYKTFDLDSNSKWEEVEKKYYEIATTFFKNDLVSIGNNIQKITKRTTKHNTKNVSTKLISKIQKTIFNKFYQKNKKKIKEFIEAFRFLEKELKQQQNISKKTEEQQQQREEEFFLNMILESIDSTQNFTQEDREIFFDEEFENFETLNEENYQPAKKQQEYLLTDITSDLINDKSIFKERVDKNNRQIQLEYKKEYTEYGLNINPTSQNIAKNKIRKELEELKIVNTNIPELSVLCWQNKINNPKTTLGPYIENQKNILAKTNFYYLQTQFKKSLNLHIQIDTFKKFKIYFELKPNSFSFVEQKNIKIDDIPLLSTTTAQSSQNSKPQNKSFSLKTFFMIAIPISILAILGIFIYFTLNSNKTIFKKK